ncbi:Contains similarity to a hypothetical protein F3C22_230 gi/7669957 from Arabidopsis thaliana BAC F3C22 gb/AL353912, partial [Arabidopsis thaliana]
ELDDLDEQTSLDELTCIDELALPGELADLGELTCAILSPGPEKRPFSRDFLFLIYTRPYSRVVSDKLHSFHVAYAYDFESLGQ